MMMMRTNNCSTMSATAYCQHAAFAMSAVLCLMGAISVVSIILFVLVLLVLVPRIIILKQSNPS